MRRTVARCFLCAALAAVLASCGGPDRPLLAPVTGRVVYQGEPVAGATVTFIHEGAPRYSYGTTDQDGTFTLTTFEPGDGAIVGTNKVTVVPPAGSAAGLTGDVPEGEAYFEALEADQQTAKAQPAVPPRYTDPDKTDLAVEVTEGENEPVLELVD